MAKLCNTVKREFCSEIELFMLFVLKQVSNLEKPKCLCHLDSFYKVTSICSTYSVEFLRSDITSKFFRKVMLWMLIWNTFLSKLLRSNVTGILMWVAVNNPNLKSGNFFCVLRLSPERRSSLDDVVTESSFKVSSRLLVSLKLKRHFLMQSSKMLSISRRFLF